VKKPTTACLIGTNPRKAPN